MTTQKKTDEQLLKEYKAQRQKLGEKVSKVKARMAKKEHFIGVDAIAKQLKSAKEEFAGVKKELTRLEEEKKNFDSIYNGYTKFRAGDNFGKLENYCESKAKSKVLSAKIEDIAKKIEEFKKNPILLAMYDRVKE